MPAQPFISYASEDREVAIWLHAELTAAGAEPWLDAVNLIPGEEWQLAIDGALSAATHVIALISARSVDKRGWVQKELRKALDLLEEWPPGKIFVIPIRLDGSKPRHPMLQRLHWVDLFDDPDAAIHRLKSSLRMDEGTPERSGSVPTLFRGYPDVSPDVVHGIVARSKQLGTDLKARGAYVQREVEAWRFLSGFSDADVPPDDLREILENLAHSYPDNMTERQLMLPREVHAWKQLQTILADLTAASRQASLIDLATAAWPRSFAGRHFYVAAGLRSFEDGF